MLPSLLQSPPESTLGADFAAFLRRSFDPASGGLGDSADISLQPRSEGAAVQVHRFVLAARCPHLSELASAAAAHTPSLPLRVDCERDELLGLLCWLYLEELPSEATPSALLRLRSLAQEWGVAALDVAASGALARALGPELCCELLRETAREEARARLAERPSPATAVALRQACAAHTSQIGLATLAASAAFKELSSAQQTWLFAQCHEGRALHALALSDSVPESIDRSMLLHALLAPPHAYDLDGRCPAAGSGDGGSTPYAAGSTPLQVALSQRNWDVASLLLDAGASTNPADLPKQRSLLHAAAEAGDASSCSFLAQRGAAINAADADGMSPLDVAVVHEQAAAATAIREHGGVPVYSHEGETLVHQLASSGRPTALAILVSAGSVDVPNQLGLTPLHLATLNGHRRTAEVLIDSRADIHTSAPPSDAVGAGGSALHLACRRGDSGLVEMLLERGASATARTDGCTPLHLAACDPQTSRLLLSAAAAVDEKDSAGCTPLHHAVSRAPPLLLGASCRALLEGGAKVNTCDFVHRHTPLHRLCERGDGGEALDALNALVAHGATINAQDKSGHTPLHLAAFRGHADLALALVAAGASPNVPSSHGMCALSSKPPAPEVLKDARAVPKALRAAMIARIAQPLPWLPDAMSDTCQVCVAAFSNSNRRHHCRHCGRIVCASCSPQKMAIPKFGVGKPTRVCVECAPVLELHGHRALGPPGVGGIDGSRAATATVTAHLDHKIAAMHIEPTEATPAASITPAPPAASVPPAASNPFGDAVDAGEHLDARPAPASGILNPFGDEPGLTPPREPPPAVDTSNPFGPSAPQAASEASSANPFENLVEGNPFDEVAPPRSGVDNPFAGVFDTASCGSLASVDEQQEVAKSHLGRGGSQESI